METLPWTIEVLEKMMRCISDGVVTGKIVLKARYEMCQQRRHRLSRVCKYTSDKYLNAY